MNYSDYIKILRDDLNSLLPDTDQFMNPIHKFRLQILVIYLHVDYLISELCIAKYNKTESEVYNFGGMGYKQKLDLVRVDFDQDWYNTMEAIGYMRNDLAHQLDVDINTQERRISIMKIEHSIDLVIQRLQLKPIHHLVLASLGYINIIAEFLFNSIKHETLTDKVGVSIGKIEIAGYPTIFTLYLEIAERS